MKCRSRSLGLETLFWNYYYYYYYYYMIYIAPISRIESETECLGLVSVSVSGLSVALTSSFSTTEVH